MLAFQFPTQVTSDGTLVLPRQYLQAIPAGSVLQVVLLVDPPAPTPVNGTKNQQLAAAHSSLEAYTAYLQQHPLPSSLISQASGLLGNHLSQPSHPAAPDFNEAAWNAEWDQLEAAMNADEEAIAQKRLQALQEDLQS